MSPEVSEDMQLIAMHRNAERFVFIAKNNSLEIINENGIARSMNPEEDLVAF